jgi:hypothetical protein
MSTHEIGSVAVDAACVKVHCASCDQDATAVTSLRAKTNHMKSEHPINGLASKIRQVATQAKPRSSLAKYGSSNG